MANEQKKQNDELLGADGQNTTNEMSVAGKPKDTVWDDMVNALHPKYGEQRGE